MLCDILIIKINCKLFVPQEKKQLICLWSFATIGDLLNYLIVLQHNTFISLNDSLCFIMPITRDDCVKMSTWTCDLDEISSRVVVVSHARIILTRNPPWAFKASWHVNTYLSVLRWSCFFSLRDSCKVERFGNGSCWLALLCPLTGLWGKKSAKAPKGGETQWRSIEDTQADRQFNGSFRADKSSPHRPDEGSLLLTRKNSASTEPPHLEWPCWKGEP